MSYEDGINTYWRDRTAFCADRYLETAEEQILRHRISAGGAGLDVGAGDGERARRCFSDVVWRHVDVYPKHVRVEKGDARDLTYSDGSFSVVLSVRVLCNVLRMDQRRAIREFQRVLRPGGRLIVCEPWKKEWRAVNEAREACGWEPLPAAACGSRPVERAFIEEEFGQPLRTVCVAADYVLWTRLAQKEMFDYSNPMRYAAPVYSDDAAWRFAFYQVREYLKV